eukprot:UN00410
MLDLVSNMLKMPQPIVQILLRHQFNNLNTISLFLKQQFFLSQYITRFAVFWQQQQQQQQQQSSVNNNNSNLLFYKLRKLIQFNIPISIAHSPNDEIIPYQFAEELYIHIINTCQQLSALLLPTSTSSLSIGNNNTNNNNNNNSGKHPHNRIYTTHDLHRSKTLALTSTSSSSSNTTTSSPHNSNNHNNNNTTNTQYHLYHHPHHHHHIVVIII